MHVKSLKVFCDVVGHRSFSRAADENGISQSGASQMVQQLEDHLGVRLIDRSKRPFVLTPEGEVYYQGCRKLVQRLSALEEEVRTLHHEVAGRVSVASIYSVGLSHMDEYVQRFQQKYPKAKVRLDFQHPAKVYELVENDHVDIGLVSFPKSSRTIKALEWRDEPMALVCAPAHALAKRDCVPLRELDGVNLVGFDRQLAIWQEVDRVLTANRVQVNVVMEFDNIENIKRAIEINAGIGLLPKPTVEREVQAGTLRVVDIEDFDLVRPLGIILRHGKELGETAQRFIEFLRAQTPSAESNGDGSMRAASRDNGRSSNGNGSSHGDGAAQEKKVNERVLSGDE